MAPVDSNKLFEKNAIESAIKIGILLAMVVATFHIVQPFIMPVLWGVIIAVAVEPLVGKMAKMMGGRRKTASVLFSLAVICALVVPSVLLVTSSIDNVQELVTKAGNDTLKVPPPPAQVENWPVIGAPLYKSWTQASTNLQVTLKRFTPQLKAAGSMMLGKVGGSLKAVFMFIISVAIAGALLATAEKGTTVMSRIINRFAGPKKGDGIIVLATATIRGVMQGVIGVAVIQAVLAAIGMVLVGVPAAGLWAGLVMLVAIIQLPPILVLGPIAAWVFTFAETTPAVVFLIWALLVSGCDGFLKPILMGRGVEAPMLVILIGALGGMMLSGIIGLFVGAVVVAIMYILFMEWVADEEFDAPEIAAEGNE